MKLKVLFDSQGFDFQHFGGVSRCLAELYKNLPADIDKKVAVRGTHNVYLRTLLVDQYAKRWGTRRLNFLARFLTNNPLYIHSWRTVNRQYSCRLLQGGDYDLLHATFFNPYFLPLLGEKPFVLTIHDMIPETCPELFPNQMEECEHKRLLAHRAAHIVAVSESTRDDVVRLLGVSPERVSVIYHSTDKTPVAYSPTRPLSAPYLLYVGARANYKLFREFVSACVPALQRHAELKILCTGSDFSSDELSFFQAQGVSDRLVHCFARTDADLLNLYHHAVAFVYSSSKEGFGIPILEAYQADCPVMLNDIQCFREVAANAALYFNLGGDEPSNFSEQFETLYSETTEQRAQRLAQQRHRLADFSWEKSAQQLADIYHYVVGK